MTQSELRRLLEMRLTEEERGGGRPAPPGPSQFGNQDMDQYRRSTISRILKGSKNV